MKTKVMVTNSVSESPNQEAQPLLVGLHQPLAGTLWFPADTSALLYLFIFLRFLRFFQLFFIHDVSL